MSQDVAIRRARVGWWVIKPWRLGKPEFLRDWCLTRRGAEREARRASWLAAFANEHWGR